MVRVSACPGRSLGTSPSFSTNVSACGHPGTGPFAKVQYRVLIMVHSPLGPPLVWTLPSMFTRFDDGDIAEQAAVGKNSQQSWGFELEAPEAVHNVAAQQPTRPCTGGTISVRRRARG